MSDFKLFINYLLKIFLPGVSLIIILLYFSFFEEIQTLSEKKLSQAYSCEIEEYAWINRIDSIDGVILGSSSLRYGLSCELLKSKDYKQWVNLSKDARDPIVFYLLLRNCLKQFKPKIVLVGLDPWIYTKLYYKYRNNIMLNDLNSHERLFYFNHVDNGLLKKILKNYFSFKYSNTTSKIIKNTPPDFGSVKLNRSARNFNEINEDWFEKKLGWSKIQFDYLFKIKGLCDSNKIRLVFVIPPKRNDFVHVSNSKFKLYNEDWWNRINNLIPKANIIGSYDALKYENQDSIFADAYHLNGRGQIIFSNYLKNNIINPKKIYKQYNFIFASKKNY
jgi:hypothetical protein